MRKLLWIGVVAAGVLTGCMPTRPESPKADAAKKEDEQPKAPAIPPVTKDTISEFNYNQKAQALEAELDRDEQKPVKAFVEAKKQ
jgi:hypothetical protein